MVFLWFWNIIRILTLRSDSLSLIYICMRSLANNYSASTCTATSLFVGKTVHWLMFTKVMTCRFLMLLTTRLMVRKWWNSGESVKYYPLDGRFCYFNCCSAREETTMTLTTNFLLPFSTIASVIHIQHTVMKRINSLFFYSCSKS